MKKWDSTDVIIAGLIVIFFGVTFFFEEIYKWL
jgi:ABC-type thiamin/hydroxymethylpyrimidine transport system permease subunit